MKLYAKIISERDSRAGNKGGNQYLQVEFTAFGKIAGYVVLEILEDAQGEPTQFLLKFAPHHNDVDWEMLKTGRKSEGAIQTIQA
jgi:hypothetical protein